MPKKKSIPEEVRRNEIRASRLQAHESMRTKFDDLGLIFKTSMPEAEDLVSDFYSDRRYYSEGRDEYNAMICRRRKREVVLYQLIQYFLYL